MLSNKETAMILEVFEESLSDGLNMRYILKRLKGVFEKIDKSQVIADMERRMFDMKGTIASGFQGILPDNLIEAISSGESQTGRLDIIFGELKRVYQLKQNVSEQVRKAVAYPIVVICGLLAVFSIILIFIMPRFNILFKAIDPRKIPASTKNMLLLSNLLRENLFASGCFLLIAVFLVIFLVKRYSFLLYRIPYIKNIMITQENATAFLLLAVFEESGINMTRYLRSVSNTLEGPLKAVLTNACKIIESGGSISDAFSKGGANNEVVTYVEVGETTGNIVKYFKRLSDIEIKNLDTMIRRMVGVLGFSLSLFAGLAIIGLFAITISPIYSMIGGL